MSKILIGALTGLLIICIGVFIQYSMITGTIMALQYAGLLLTYKASKLAVPLTIIWFIVGNMIYSHKSSK